MEDINHHSTEVLWLQVQLPQLRLLLVGYYNLLSYIVILTDL